VAHFFSLGAGLYYDDHAHFAGLRRGDWSFRSAVEAAELGRPDQVMDLWGEPGGTVRFFRPVAFWIMRAEYTLLGWPVDGGIGIHLFSMAWHWAAAMLTVAFAYRLLGLRSWALLAGIWLATHPNNMLVVHWIACQTELMVTVFVLSAVLCYARWSGWWTADGSARASFLLLIAALTLFSLGLGCRENAVVVPVMAFLGDFCLRTGALLRRGRWVVYLAFTAIVIVYFVIRYQALGGFPVPDPMYFHRPSEPGFLAFVVTKSMYYVLAMFAHFPVVPIGGLPFLREHPGFFYPCFALCAAVLLVVIVALRHHRGMWISGIWMLVAMGIMAPVFASAHHLYLPMVGASVVLAAGLALLAGRLKPVALPGGSVVGSDANGNPASNARRRVAAVLVALILVLQPLGTLFNGWICRTGTSTEDEVIREILTYDRPLRDGDHLFFVDLPIAAFYVKPALENRLGMTLHGHVLTFAPSILGMEQPSTIEQIDEHSFTVSLDRYGYMAGRAGQVLRGALRRTEPFETGEVIRAGEYEVTVLDANETGIAKLEFTFDRPLSEPSYHIYVGSRIHFAYPLPLAPSPLVSSGPGS